MTSHESSQASCADAKAISSEGIDPIAIHDLRFAWRLILAAFVLVLVFGFVLSSHLPESVRELPTRFIVLALGAWGFVRMRSRLPAPVMPVATAVRIAVPLGLLNIVSANAIGIGLAAGLIGLGFAVPTPPAPPASGIGSALWYFVTSVILTVPGEELLFRGTLLPALLPAGRRAALWGSALAFGAMHMHFLTLPFGLVLGAVTAALALRTGSIVPGMILHAVGNTCGVVVALTPALREPATRWATTWTPESGLLIVGGAAVFGLSLFVYRNAVLRLPALPSEGLGVRARPWTVSAIALAALYVALNALFVAMLVRK